MQFSRQNSCFIRKRSKARFLPSPPSFALIVKWYNSCLVSINSEFDSLLGHHFLSECRKVWFNPPALGAGERRFESFYSDQNPVRSKRYYCRSLCDNNRGRSTVKKGAHQHRELEPLSRTITTEETKHGDRVCNSCKGDVEIVAYNLLGDQLNGITSALQAEIESSILSSSTNTPLAQRIRAQGYGPCG